ncbi:hypothetical protein O3P69_009584 [Scylla paramamosain]|uniref:DNA ligase n=1 Tax=Scylla paramamosain TaxID=85552 RepID=A0AAW0SVU3_SCYPA
MVQKSILSFFAAKPAQGAEGGSEGGGSRRAASEESPVKRSVKRRSRVIESESEEEDNRADDGDRKNKKLKEQDETKKAENGKHTEEEEEKKEEEEEKENHKSNKTNTVRRKRRRKEKEEEEEDGPCSSSVTPKKESQCPPPGRPLGFTPETVPPLRRTARKKRLSVSPEEKQKDDTKKQRKEEEKGSPVSSKTKKEAESEEEMEVENKSKQEDEKEEEKKEEMEEVKEKLTSPAGRPKPTIIHSFFTSMKTSAAKSKPKETPPKIKKEEEEEKMEKTPGSGDPGADYDPRKANYHPIKDAFWQKGQKMPYLALAKTLEAIEETSGRLKIVEILANFLRSVIVLSPDDLLFCVYLCLNKVAPAFEGLELRIGDTILIRAIAQASGRSPDKIKADAERLGDLGIVAEQSRTNQRVMFQPAKLTVAGVFKKLKEIALMTGHASQAKKIDLVKGMYVACRFCEAKFLVRSLGGKLRIGLAEQSVLMAIAQACYLTPPGQEYPPEVVDAGAGRNPDKLKAEIDEYALILKTTYCEFPSYDKIIPVLLQEGLEKLPEHCKLTPGVPLKPMLAHPTTGVSEVLKRFENAKFTCEFKYDGERAQIHMKEDGTINIYSRNQEDNTSKYPDIISRFKNFLGENVKSCVVDSEAVAWDREKNRILPFQILSTRKKKDARESQITVQVCVFPFDLLYLNGDPSGA